MRGVINMSRDELDSPVYRVFSLKRFLELLASGRNTLVRPRLWDDPFENYILQATAELGKQQSVSIGFKDQLYGQCWSSIRESDAMWRIYSPEKTGVRVKTSLRALYQSLRDGSSSAHTDLSCFIGRVEYRPENELVSELQKTGLFSEAVLDANGVGQASTLLYKRQEFEHEAEIRLIYFDHESLARGDLFHYELEPSEVFEEVCFDPRMSDELFDILKAHLEGVGFEGRFLRSRLYQAPSLKVQISGTA